MSVKLKKIYCVFNEDDDGTPIGDAIAAFPIKSAAQKYIKNSKDIYLTILPFDSIEVDGDFYLLKSPRPVKLISFLQSRQLAIDNALSKLTEEEKSLLGLIL